MGTRRSPASRSTFATPTLTSHPSCSSCGTGPARVRTSSGSRFHELAEVLLRAESSWQRAAARVPAARAATRDELWRRLHRARDFVHAHATAELDLQRVAKAACLAPHHFHRLYRATFGETPHRTVTRLRLERAMELLRRPDASVTRVCFEVGYSSPGSFSTLFRREMGISPAAYRAGRTPTRKIREAAEAPVA